MTRVSTYVLAPSADWADAHKDAPTRIIHPNGLRGMQFIETDTVILCGIDVDRGDDDEWSLNYRLAVRGHDPRLVHCDVDHDAVKARPETTRYFLTGSDTEPDLNITVDMADLERRFTYHPPQPGQSEVYQAIRDKARGLAALILSSSPRLAGTECETAIQKIEEAVMWANAGIARHGPSPYTYVRVEHNGEDFGTPPYDQTTFECDAWFGWVGHKYRCLRTDPHTGQGDPADRREWEGQAHWSTPEEPSLDNQGLKWADDAEGAGRGE